MTHPAPDTAPRQRRPAILIVDDAPANLGLLRKIMTSQGYQAFVATSGERALEIAQQVQPDLILLDVVMPGMDGFETCRQLKSHALTGRIPVIFMSAKTETDAVVNGFDLGAVDYISKPLRMPEVCARVRSQLQMRSTSATQQEQAERLRSIVDSMAEGLLIIEDSGRIQYTNAACGAYLGYGPAQLDGQSISTLFSGAVAEECLDYFARCQGAPAAVAPPGARAVMVRRRDGALRAMDLTLTPMYVRGHLFVGLLHDTAHHEQSALQLDALVDPLTGIANRRHFATLLEVEWQRAVRSGEPLSLIVLEVDHFKPHNDTLGNAAGDHVLRTVAAALQAHAPRASDLAARYGAEEFVVLFGETRGPDALAMAEAIRAYIEALRLPNPRSPRSGSITVSIGVATMIPTQVDEIDPFFCVADRAMRAAREGGRNRVHAVDAGIPAWEAVKALIMRQPRPGAAGPEPGKP